MRTDDPAYTDSPSRFFSCFQITFILSGTSSSFHHVWLSFAAESAMQIITYGIPITTTKIITPIISTVTSPSFLGAALPSIQFSGISALVIHGSSSGEQRSTLIACPSAPSHSAWSAPECTKGLRLHRKGASGQACPLRRTITAEPTHPSTLAHRRAGPCGSSWYSSLAPSQAHAHA